MAEGPTPHLARRPGLALVAAAALLIVALGAAGLALVWRDRPTAVASVGAEEPAVVVMPLRPVGTAAVATELADGIGQELVGDLMPFHGFRVYMPPLGAADEDVGALARSRGIAYAVTGSVRMDGGTIRLAVQVANATSGQVLWTGVYDREARPGALIAVERELAAEIATVLGQPYGVVNNDVERQVDTPAVSSMESYVCVLKAYGYRRTFSAKAYAPLVACLEAAVARDPDYADALAMLGWLYLDGGRFGLAAGDRAAAYAKAHAAASRAVAIAPRNTLALKALSSIDHYMGRYDEAERLAREAVALNPYDPDTLAQLGWRLAVRGKFEEGIPLLERAIARTVEPPDWYFHLIVIDLYLKGETREMLDVARRSARGGSPISQMLLAIAADAEGDTATLREAMARLPADSPIRRDVAAVLRLHGATDEIAERLAAGFRAAGRRAAASTGTEG